MNPASSGQDPRLWDRLALVLLLIGGGLRLEAWLSGRPLWMDEAMLALNVVSRGLGGLIAPLDLSQVAPVPFLWLSRLSVALLGPGEIALRLVPFVAGLVLPWFLWRPARHLFGPAPAALATGMASLSLLLVYYSAEFKPYIVDAAISAGLVFAVAPRLRHRLTRADWWRIGAGGAAALACSLPAAFVLSGVFCALAWHCEPWRHVGSRRSLALLALAWGVVFLLQWLWLYRPASSDPYLTAYWAGTALVPGTEDFAYRAHLAASAVLVRPLALPGDLLPLPAAVAAFALGLWAAWRRAGTAVLLLVLVPYVTMAGASALGLFPVAERLVLFLVPLTLLAYGGAFALAAEVVSAAWWRRGLPAVVLGAWGLATLPALARYLVGPRPAWDARSLINEVPATATVYVFGRAASRWLFYTEDWRRPGRARTAFYLASLATSGPAFQNSPPRGRAVACEGDQLVWRGRRRELLGIPTGIRHRMPYGGLGAPPDPGWADNEVRRMRAAGDTVWAYLSLYGDAVLAAYVTAIAEAGGTILRRDEQRDRLRPAPGPGYSERNVVMQVAFGPARPRDTCRAGEEAR